MTEKLWKVAERKFSCLFRGQGRSGATGKNSPDIKHPFLAPEVKSSAVFPKWLREAMEQAETNAPKGKLPIVLLHFRGNEYTNDIVALRVKDAIAVLDKAGLLGKQPIED